MSSLRLFLLGQPRLERDGQPLTFDTRKNVALVAYLALTGGRCSRETLITLLWPELEPRRARAVLRRNLSVLGKALGGEWLVVDGDEIGTDPGADFWLDVDRFRHLLSTCEMHGHSDAQVCSQCLDALAQAVELYRGDLRGEHRPARGSTPPLTSGSSSKQRACGRRSPPRWRSWYTVTAHAASLGPPSGTPGAGWPWTPCTNRLIGT